MSWNTFYNSIRNDLWPDCPTEDEFNNLPTEIKEECINTYGYRPKQYKEQSRLPHRIFPIQTDTACQLKWNWSSIYLTTEDTASCHRTNHHAFNTDTFDFHNTPEKIQDRERMLRSEWPERGCEYCQNIEKTGGISDRITNLDLQGNHAPIEMDIDVNETRVTPRILEVYFDNTCNLKCLYCSPSFSSLWDAEVVKFGNFEKNGVIMGGKFAKSPNIQRNKQKLFEWLKVNGQHLTRMNILGGEPLYQDELIECLDFFDQYPAPDMELEFFSNLNVKKEKLVATVAQIKRLLDQGKIRKFNITASIDCWGPQQEFVRYPLDLANWEKNFEYILDQDYINIIIGSTVTPLTVKTLPDLLDKFNSWYKRRPIYHYFNSVTTPTYFHIDILGNIFADDFKRILDLMPENTHEQKQVKEYMQGIAQQSASRDPNIPEVLKLQTFLDEMDRRRSTNWRTLFPWLDKEFKRLL